MSLFSLWRFVCISLLLYTIITIIIISIIVIIIIIIKMKSNITFSSPHIHTTAGYTVKNGALLSTECIQKQDDVDVVRLL